MSRYILVYTNYAAPYEGNFFASQKALARAISGYGYKTIVTIPEEGEKYLWTHELSNSVDAVFFTKDKGFNNIKMLVTILNKYDVAFVHTHFISRKQLLELKCAILIAKNNPRVVEHFHNHYLYNDGRIKQICKKLLMHNDYIVGCSSGVKESLERGKLKNNITYIDNAIDFSRFSLEENNRNIYSLLMFGADYERKGVDIALKACDILLRKSIPVELNICISVNKEKVEENIRGIYESIPHWIHLLAPTEQIEKYYRNSGIFISPSREEGLCYALIEAAYCGCIVIASEISGQKEIQIPEFMWCKKENADDLANKIEYVVKMHNDELDYIKKKEKSSSERNYSLKRWVDEMVEYYIDKGLIKR